MFQQRAANWKSLQAIAAAFFFIRTATRGAMMVLCAHALASFLGLWSVASFCDRTLKAPARGSTDAEFQTPPERLSSIPQVRIEASE
jgi:hypothetical protein